METELNFLISEQETVSNLLKNSPVRTITMERLKFIEKRLYVLPDPFKVYAGLTGSLEAATFKGDRGSKRLSKWRDKMREELGGQKQQEAYLGTMADFGSALHTSLVRIKNDGKLNWKAEQEAGFAFFEQSAKKNGIVPNLGVMRAQVFELCKAAASLLQFCYDNVIEMYAIEAMTFCDDLEIATPCDLICKIKTKTGEPIVNLNLKTSEQFSDSHRKQVAIEKYLWNQTYPDFPVEQTGLLRGKDWNQKKGIPTYELELLDKETDTQMTESTLAKLKLCKADPESSYLNYQKEIPIFTGISKLGEAPIIITKTLEEMFKETQSAKLDFASQTSNNGNGTATGTREEKEKGKEVVAG